MVTGAAGFIGSRLCARLLDGGWRVVGVDAFTDSYDPAEKRERARKLERRPRFELVSLDLATTPLADPLAGVGVVFHLAGRAGVRPSFQIAERYVHDNVLATSRLLAACEASPSVRRLVYASSSSVYGAAAVPFAEEALPAPISPYGETKLEAERLCLDACGASLETVALRLFTVYGPGQRPDMALRRFAEAALRGTQIELLGDGSQTRDFTHVDDVVQAFVLAATAPVAGLAVNVGGGSRISLRGVLAVLEELVERPLRMSVSKAARGDVRHTEAEPTRARELLGFRPRVGFPDGYATEVRWLAQRRPDLERRSA